MGYELRRWLADRLPASLSSGERLVALEIADQAKDQTRRAYGRDLLDTVVRRTGLANQKQLGAVLGKLAAAGIELREPVRDGEGREVTDKRGRVLYACKGHALEFRIPRLADCPALVDLPSSGSERSRARGTKESSRSGGTNGVQSSRARGTKVPPARDPSPQSPQPTSSSPGTPVVTSVSAAPGGGGKSQQEDGQTLAAAAFLEDLPAPWTIGPRSAKAMAPLLIQMTSAQGWRLDTDLVAELTKNPDGVRDHPRVVPRRISDLPKRSQPAANSTMPLPVWCGHCGDGLPAAKTQAHLRRVFDDRGNAHPCPNCNPAAATAA